MRGVLLSFGVILAGCSGNAPQQGLEMPAVPVHAVAVEVRDVPLFFEAVGVIKPAMTAEVKPRVSGLIEQVHFTEGQVVEKGALLYTLERASYAIRVQEAEAQRDQILIDLAHAKKKLERYQGLTKQDLIARVEWDELESKIAMHEAMLKASEARLNAAKLDLMHCKIRAPMRGIAGKSALQAGNMTTAETLVTLTQVDPLYVDFSITEKEVQQIFAANPVIKICAAGKQECLAEGVVTFMDHSIDSKSGLLAACGKLERCYARILPGQSVTVRLYYDKKEGAQLIPMGAIRTNQDGPYVFAIRDDNTVEIRSVKLGAEENGFVVVEGGLEGAGKVVTQGQQRLFPGSKIEEKAQ